MLKSISKWWFSYIATREIKTTTLSKLWTDEFSTYNFLFKIQSNTASQENSIDEEIAEEIKGLFVKENLYAEIENDKVLNWWNFN